MILNIHQVKELAKSKQMNQLNDWLQLHIVYENDKKEIVKEAKMRKKRISKYIHTIVTFYIYIYI